MKWRVADSPTHAGGFDIYLLTPEQLKHIPDGTVLYSILGERKVVGKDHIDDDTRGGYLAFGTTMPWDWTDNHE